MRRAAVSSLLLCMLVATLNATLVHSLKNQMKKSNHLVRVESYDNLAQRVITRWSQSTPSYFDGMSELTIFKKSELNERVACIEFDDTCFKEGAGPDLVKQFSTKNSGEFKITGAGSSWKFKQYHKGCKIFDNLNKKDYSMVICESAHYLFVMEGATSNAPKYLVSILKDVAAFKQIKE